MNCGEVACNLAWARNLIARIGVLLLKRELLPGQAVPETTMYRARMLRSAPLIALVTIGAPHLTAAQVNRAEPADALCEVSAEQIVAATSQQLVLLDTQDCSMDFAGMVDRTVARMRKSY